MVEGLRLEVVGSELAERLRARVEWHRRKADADDEKRRAVEGAADKIRETLGSEIEDEVEVEALLTSETQGYYSKDTARGYLQKITNHRRRAEFLEFFASHIKVTEVYILTEEELIRFEILGN